MTTKNSSSRIGLYIMLSTAGLLLVLFALYLRAGAATNHVALAATPKPVATVRARRGDFQPVRAYVGTLEPWDAARVGPQYVSAYVGTVLVRPGAVVRRGQVLATLDCRGESANSKQIAARASALEDRQAALAHQTERTKELIQGGFASANEVEQLTAKTSSEAAEVASLRASLLSQSLQVDDCILRAPFKGEVSEREVDPGAYVRPGNPVVTVVDRSTVRVTAEAPESDFDVVRPGAEVEIATLATGAKFKAPISRRAPAADPVTRTVHFEVDLPNANRALPVGTTASLSIAVGKPQTATVVTLQAATVRGDKAQLFVVDKGIAKRVVVPVLGERAGTLFLDPKLPDGAEVVLEGRALLEDGDRVSAKEAGE